MQSLDANLVTGESLVLHDLNSGRSTPMNTLAPSNQHAWWMRRLIVAHVTTALRVVIRITWSAG